MEAKSRGGPSVKVATATKRAQAESYLRVAKVHVTDAVAILRKLSDPLDGEAYSILTDALPELERALSYLEPVEATRSHRKGRDP